MYYIYIYIYITCMYLLYIEWSTDILPHKQSPSMKIFTFAAKTIANCTHKSSTKILKKKRRLWPTSIRLGCLATCFATNLLGHHGCSRLGLHAKCWRLVMKKANQSKWKAWDAKFYTTGTRKRSWNVFHGSMSDFIGRSFHIEIFRRFRHAPNLQLQEDSLAKKSHWCQGKCAGQFEVQPLQGLDINKSVTS